MQVMGVNYSLCSTTLEWCSLQVQDGSMRLCSCSPACGIVRSWTASKTSELSIWGALFSQDHCAYKGGFLRFFSSSPSCNNHRSCSSRWSWVGRICWKAADVLAQLWSGFLQVAVGVRCSCPACYCSLFLLFSFAVSPPCQVILGCKALNCSRSLWACAGASLRRWGCYRQTDRQGNPMKLDRTVYVRMCPLTVAGGGSSSQTPAETTCSSGLHLKTWPSWEGR